MKTYGTYTDCSGKEQQLDAFHMHELLDRIHMIRAMFSDFVEDHPAAKHVKDDTDEIGKMLSRLYQRVGRIEFEGLK